MYRVFKGLGVIYYVTHWVIYSSVAIGNVEAKTYNLK